MTGTAQLGLRARVAVFRLTARVRRLAALGLPPAPPRLTGDEYARALLLAAALGWLADTTPANTADRDGDVLAEVERHYPGGVRQLALDTFIDALTSTPLPWLVLTASTSTRVARAEGA